MYQLEGKYPDRRSHLALEHLRLKCPQSYNNGGLLPTNGPQWHRIRSLAQVRGPIFLTAVIRRQLTRDHCCNFFFWQPICFYKSNRAMDRAIFDTNSLLHSFEFCFILLFSAELKPRGHYLEHVFYLDHVIFTNMSQVN